MEITKFWSFSRGEETEEPDRERPGEPDEGTGMPEAPESYLDIEGEIVAEECWLSEGCCLARDFREALDGVGNVTVRINSPGGDVMAGAEIYSALREHTMNGKGRVRVVVTAIAASAASVIAMAGDEILMYPTSYMMIHNPWSMAVGNAKTLRQVAKTLDEIAQGIINAYQHRTGKSRDELKRMLEAETYMSAGTCVEEGFADRIIGWPESMAEMAARPAAMVRMSGKAHGAQELAERYWGLRVKDADEDPDEEPETEDPEEGDGDPDGDGEPEEPDEETEPDARADTGTGATAEETEPDGESDPDEDGEHD